MECELSAPRKLKWGRMRIGVKLITGLSGPVSHPCPRRFTFADTGRPPANPFKQHSPPCRFGAPFSGHSMTAIDRTAYPRPEVRLTREELGERYHLSDAELAFIHASARGDTGRLLLAMLLKSRRDLVLTQHLCHKPPFNGGRPDPANAGHVRSPVRQSTCPLSHAQASVGGHAQGGQSRVV